MTPREAYLALIRAALWAPDAPLAEDCRIALSEEALLQEVLRIADSQRTRGLVYDLLLQNCPGIPEDLAKQMQQTLFRIVGANGRLDANIGSLTARLQQTGLPFILLKGQANARRYPVPTLRECGDIDLYIGPERFADAILTARTLADNPKQSGLNGKHFCFRYQDAEVEFHKFALVPVRRRMRKPYHLLEASRLTQGTVSVPFGTVQVPIPEPTFNAFYLFAHAWHHFLTGGLGLRQLCDWVLLLSHERTSIDRERLWAILSSLDLLGPWRMLGCIAVHELGVPEGEFPFYDASAFARSRKVLHIILQDGNFGIIREYRNGERPDKLLRGKLFALRHRFLRFTEVFPLAPREALANFVAALRRGTCAFIKRLTNR
jgi:hypothetical protein